MRHAKLYNASSALQPAIAFAIREQLYEVSFIGLLMYHFQELYMVRLPQSLCFHI